MSKVICKDLHPLVTHGDFVTICLHDGLVKHEIVFSISQISFLRDQLDFYLESNREPD